MPCKRIKHLRSLLLIHSYIYYRLDTSVVSDHQWQHWADELVRLQADHGIRHGWYDNAFSDWRGDTGCHLPKDEWVVSKAAYILDLSDKYGA